MFTGILASDQVVEVPHFRDKTRAEEYLTKIGSRTFRCDLAPTSAR